jgi:hypothetical protein
MRILQLFQTGCRRHQPLQQVFRHADQKEALPKECFFSDHEILAEARTKSAIADEIQAVGLDEIKSTHRLSDFIRPKGGFYHRR